jgi:uncharacterized repeat protein (TIGR01451 family)
MTVVLTASPPSVLLGEQVTYLIKITNTGDQTLTGVSVADTAASSTCEGATNSIPVGSIRNISCSAIPEAAGIFGNSVTVSAAGTPAVTSNTVTTQVDEPTGSFSVSLAGPAVVALGESITYQLTINNLGATALTGVTVTSTLEVTACDLSLPDIAVGAIATTSCAFTPATADPVTTSLIVDTDQTAPFTSIPVTTDVLLVIEDCIDTPFSDVPLGHPFIADICWVSLGHDGHGPIAEGYSDGTFRPAADVSRQAMAAFMYRLAGEPEFDPPADPSFPDVPESSTFFSEIEWLVDVGITTGFPGGTFRPAAPVSRQAMSAFMYRLAGEPEFEPPAEASFADVPTSSQFFTEIEWMADEEITTGYGDGSFRPAISVKRQSMSAFMHRLADGPGVD